MPHRPTWSGKLSQQTHPFHDLECVPQGIWWKKWKTSAVSTTDWMIDTQLCKLRGTSIFRYYTAVVAQNLRKVVRACYIFDHERYRSVNPPDVVRINRTISHYEYNHSALVLKTRIEGILYLKIEKRLLWYLKIEKIHFSCEIDHSKK